MITQYFVDLISYPISHNVLHTEIIIGKILEVIYSLKLV